MKKLVLLALCGVLLCGCSSSLYDIEITGGKTELMSYNKMSISKQDYFEVLLAKYGAQTIVENALCDIAKKEITDTKAVEDLVESKKETYATYYNGNIDDVAKANGYSDTDLYIKNIIEPQAYLELLNKTYIKENYDSLIKDTSATRFKVILCDKESDALALIEKTKDNLNKFDALMKDNENAEDVDIVTKNDSLDSNIIEILPTLSAYTKDQIYSKAVKLTNGAYAVLYVYDTARDDKEEWINALNNDSKVVETAEGHYLKKYNFTVYDETLSETIKNLSSQYLE